MTSHFFSRWLKWSVFLLIGWVLFQRVYQAYELQLVMVLVDLVLKPDHDFDPLRVPPPPDYHLARSWAALPNRTDSADSFVILKQSSCSSYFSSLHAFCTFFFQTFLHSVSLLFSPISSPISSTTTTTTSTTMPFSQDDGSLADDLVFGDNQSSAAADLFYLPPTGFYSGRAWLADPFENWLVHLKDAGMQPQQATALNHIARVFSPRVREMAAYNYFSPPEVRLPAFQVAYSDVQRAFLHYLAHWSGGASRPLFLLGHSQGAELLLRLIQDHFPPGSALRQRLVVAYLIGFPVYADAADAAGPGAEHRAIDPSALPACRDALATQCVISWRTFARGGDPSLFLSSRQMLFGHSFQNDPAVWRDVAPLCVNPLSWLAGDGPRVARGENLGAMALIQPRIDLQRWLRAGALSYAVDDEWSDPARTHELVTSTALFSEGGMTPLVQGLVGAQCEDGALWIEESDLPWFSPFWSIAVFPGKNYHAYDINFFWLNIRLNAQERLAHFIQQQNKTN